MQLLVVRRDELRALSRPLCLARSGRNLPTGVTATPRRRLRVEASGERLRAVTRRANS